MKISFIATVYNEQSTVKDLLTSIFAQSRAVDEVIIVDGGSRDKTVESIKYYVSSIKKKKLKFKLLVKKGNRSVGRNEGIKNTTGDIVLTSDAGCILDKDWVRNIAKPFEDPRTDVVAGYYKGKTKTVFQKCLVPYALVMENRLDPKSFLPATRSMAFKKSIWKKVGGFPEEYSHNEDFVFANRLKKVGANIKFERNAIVYWTPRKNIKDTFIMFFRFSLGDVESGIIRPKILLIFIRYIFAIFLIITFIHLGSFLILNTLFLILFLYILWSIFKNYKYVKDIGALFFLPLLQFISDVAILSGSVIGLVIFFKRR